MKKQEFIHLHGLFAQITEDFEDRGENMETPTYDGLETRPSSIHKSKTDHKKAVLTLAGEIADNLETESEVEA